MINDVDSSPSEKSQPAPGSDRHDRTANGWLKVGTIAAASAVLGGLAAAWFYRKTLSRLREAENEIQDSESPSIENATEEDF